MSEFSAYSLEVAEKHFLPDVDGKREFPLAPKCKIGLGIGIIVTIGGIIAVLAAHQIVPIGLNAISQLNPYSYVIGYSALALGVGTTALMIRKRMQYKKTMGQIYDGRLMHIQLQIPHQQILAISIPEGHSKAGQIHILTWEKRYLYSGKVPYYKWLQSRPSWWYESTHSDKLGKRTFMELEVSFEEKKDVRKIKMT